jgi:hypothetical protein
MAARSSGDGPTLTLRQLDRALLARQMLLKRERVDVVTAVERLGALQAQWPPAPYVGLWSRLARFSVAELEGALTDRRVVKATLMRGTLHLASAADYPAFAVATREARRALWPSTQRQALKAMARSIREAARYVDGGGVGIADPAKTHEALLRHAATPRTRQQLVAFIAAQAKAPLEVATHLVWGFVAAFGMFVHVPASGLWSSRRSGELVAARVALRGMKTPGHDEAVLHTVRRYLAAFGPASVDDVSSWTSLRTPPIRRAVETLGSEIRIFRDERGRTLYDLARAPRPSADVTAPVRFLPKWDSTLLAYTPAERVRILPETHRKAVIIKNGDVAQTFLVDGMVAGTWALVTKAREAVVEMRPFAKVSPADRASLLEEGEALARFLAPEARTHGARV